MSDAMEEWFDQAVRGAPDRLAVAARAWWEAAEGDSAGARLAEAGRRALEAAIAAGATRDAALDLLAADGLITMALLAEGEHDPVGLGARAAALRAAVTPT